MYPDAAVPRERRRIVVGTMTVRALVARSIKDIPAVYAVLIPETSIKEINPLLLFAADAARREERRRGEGRGERDAKNEKEEMTNARGAKLRPADPG